MGLIANGFSFDCWWLFMSGIYCDVWLVYLLCLFGCILRLCWRLLFGLLMFGALCINTMFGILCCFSVACFTTFGVFVCVFDCGFAGLLVVVVEFVWVINLCLWLLVGGGGCSGLWLVVLLLHVLFCL